MAFGEEERLLVSEKQACLGSSSAWQLSLPVPSSVQVCLCPVGLGMAAPGLWRLCEALQGLESAGGSGLLLASPQTRRRSFTAVHFASLALCLSPTVPPPCWALRAPSVEYLLPCYTNLEHKCIFSCPPQSVLTKTCIPPPRSMVGASPGPALLGA